jgi:four helix bundle protein
VGGGSLPSRSGLPAGVGPRSCEVERSPRWVPDPLLSSSSAAESVDRGYSGAGPSAARSPSLPAQVGTSQVDRSPRSVAANIAEGEHRHDGKSRPRLETAYGSARETRAHLEVAIDVGLLREAEVASAIELTEHLVASL